MEPDFDQLWFGLDVTRICCANSRLYKFFLYSHHLIGSAFVSGECMPSRLFEALRALAHPARMEFLIWLGDPQTHFGLTESEARDGVSAGRFEKGGLSQSTVSAHLAILQRAGFLTAQRCGQKVLYRRNERFVAWFKKALGDRLKAGGMDIGRL